MNYIGEFEKTLAPEAQRHAADGVICGHIHHAAIHDDFGVRYVNCGDWVESCTRDRRACRRPASRSSPVDGARCDEAGAAPQVARIGASDD